MLINNIGIIGYGRFGKILANILSQDFDIYVYDKMEKKLDYNGVKFRELENVASCNTVFFCVPVNNFEEAIIEALPYIKKGSVVLDVCASKVYSRDIMKKYLPESVDIIPTHPIFGPDSISNGLENLPYVICPLNSNSESLEFWKKYLESKGLKVVLLSCEEHDKITAYSICLTQLIGRAVDRLGIKPSNIDTNNFKNLLQMREIACNDTYELFKDIQNYNPFTKEMRVNFCKGLKEIESLLNG